MGKDRLLQPFDKEIDVKILYLAKTLDKKSGWGRYAAEVVKRAGREHEVRALVEDASGEGYESLQIERVTSLFTFWKNVRAVKKYARDFDVIHALDLWPYGAIAYLASRGGTPFFINIIGSYSVAPLYSSKKLFVLKRALLRAEKVFCISNFAKQEVLKKVNTGNLEVVFLGIDHGKFKPAGKPRNERLVLSVGALKRRKGYEISLKAFERTRQMFPDLRYIIVGSADQPGYADSLKRYVQEQGLSSAVEFRSGITDEELIELYHQACVFMLLPVNYKHHFEGFGLVYLEAAATGLPVIGTLDNGVEDAVDDGVNGFLVKQNDVEGAAAALGKILGDSDLREGFSQNAVKFASGFSWDKTVSTYTKFYEAAARKDR